MSIYKTKSWLSMLFLLVSVISPRVYATNELIISTVESPISKRNTKIISKAYAKIGYNIRVVNYPSSRALNMSNSGRVDGELNRIANITDFYPNLIQIPVEIAPLEAVVFSKNLIFEVMGWASLKPYRIGVLQGVKYSDIGTTGMQRQFMSNYEQLFQMLEKGRIDVAIAPKISGLATLSALGITNFNMLSPPIKVIPLYHFLHKKNKHLVPLITDELLKMKDNGLLY